jgi:hypothetical protein
MDHMTKSKSEHPDVNGKPNYHRKPKDIREDILDSAMRHLLDVYQGKMTDNKSGSPSLICCAANLMIAHFHTKDDK